MAKETKPYQSPELHTLPQSPLLRPPMDERRITPMPEVAGHNVEKLIAQFGSPLCVIDEGALRSQYRRMINAFRSGWEDTFIGTSVKTNYLSAMVAIMREEGAWGEVVSGFEYRLCRDLGIPGEEILFNGPWKTDEDVRLAIKEGAKLHLDGDDELRRISAIAADMNCQVKVGLRVNMQVNYPPWDKFGFKLENDHSLEAAKEIMKDANLSLDGLHLHVGTYIPDPSMYARAVEALINLGLRIERELDGEISYLDLGGGYATRNTLHHTLLPGEALCVTPEEYAEAITGPLRKAASRFKRPPRLFIEPGRIMVDEALTMLTTVRAIKRVPGGQKAALVDCGVHILPTAYWYDHEVHPVVDHGGSVEEYKMVGPLCMQIDVLRQSVNLPSLKVGDQLVIRDVGAYNFSQSMQFIYMRPNYVLAHSEGLDVIRSVEEDEYVRSKEIIPSHLINSETSNSFLVKE